MTEPRSPARSGPAGGDAPLVSYVIRTLPKLSETFVLRELVALHSQGVPLEIWTLVPAEPGDAAKVPEFAAIAPLVRAAPTGRSGLREMTRDLLWLLARRPRQTLRAIGWAVRWTLHDRDPRQVAALPFAAYLARHARGRHFHAHFANTPATTAILAGMLSGPSRGASFTGHARDLWTATSEPFLREKIARARFVVVGTEVTQRFIEDVASGGTEVVLARHGVEFDGRPVPDRRAHEPGLVVGVGRLVEKKGFGDLLHAVADVSAAGVDVRLALVGDGPMEPSLRARAKVLGIAGRVDFLGAQSQDEISAVLARAAVFALPCVQDSQGDADTFPLAIVEAMRAAVPVLTTTLGEMGHVLDDGVTARVVPPQSPKQLGAALLDLLTDPAAAEAIGAAGRALAQRNYDTAQAVAPLIAAFRRAAG